MSDFKAKMQVIFRPDPDGGAYSTPPDTLAGFKGPTSKERGREGKGWSGGKEGSPLYFFADLRP